MLTPYRIIGLMLLTACGDASQDSSYVGSPEKQKTFVASEGTRLEEESLPPLASDFLRFTRKEAGREPFLSEIRFASAAGHSPNTVTEATEALGLVGRLDAPFALFGTDSLAAGLTWKELSLPRALDLSPVDGRPTAALTEMQLSLDGIPVHNARIKAIVENGETTWVNGSKPQWLENADRPSMTPFALSIEQARQKAALALAFSEWRFHSAQRTYVAEATRARAVWLFIVSAEYRAGDRGPIVPLEIAVDADVGEVLWQRPLALHVDGSASLYVENKVASSRLEAVSLPALRVGDKLEHPLFDVLNCQKKARHLEPSFCRALASGSAGAFSASYTDDRYDELVAYAAVTKAMERFRALDQTSLRSDWDQSKWPGSRSDFGLQPTGSNSGSERRLKIFVNTETQAPSSSRCGQTTPDNAQYLWSGYSGTGNPEILIGYGGYGVVSCGSLRELGKDMDVVMHEFGHHIVFRGLSNAKQQSVALHEGYADYLTYAVSGNNLLAENSFPGRSSLRTGVIPSGQTFYRFRARQGGGYLTVLDYMSAPHTVGEFWSGMLWEMRIQLGRDASGNFKMDKIVWDSLDLLKSDGGLSDGILAISQSASRYAERTGEDASALTSTINNIFVKYEFARVGSNGELYPADALTGGSSGGEQVQTTKKKKWGCGDLSQLSQSSTTRQANGLWLALLLMFPAAFLTASQFHKRVAARIPIRIRKKRSKN